MRVVFLLLFLLLPLLVSIHAEDLGELNANPARLSGSFSSFGLSGFFDPPDRFSGPANKTDQIDQTNEIDQFRLSVLTELDQQSLRRRESLQPQQSHKSLRPRPEDRRTLIQPLNHSTGSHGRLSRHTRDTHEKAVKGHSSLLSTPIPALPAA